MILCVQYCANDTDCSDYHYNVPASDLCTMSTSLAVETYHTWEGGWQSCTFSTGVTFSWYIESGAVSQYSWAG